MATDLFDGVNGHDVRRAHTNARDTVVVTQPTWRWPFLRAPGERADQEPAGRPGTGMIRIATALLFVLGLGLLGVSVAAQYKWVLSERHQHLASLVEAVALDIGMIIMALLALGLARAGLAAKAERGLVVVCAAGSAVMNYAAADVTSPRSVLAYVMPPIFLAVVVDRVVVTVRRHVLGMRDGRSPWAVAGRVALWLLRAALDPWPTARGVRRMVLAATPLPAPAPKAAITPAAAPETTRGASPRPGSKTAQFIALVIDRYGPLAQVPVRDVSRIAGELAPEVDLNAGSARTVLRAHVLAAQDGGGQ
jgi:hypothetical protein